MKQHQTRPLSISKVVVLASSPSISEVVVLTRRDLSAEQKASPKVKAIMLPDFERYDDVLGQLAESELPERSRCRGARTGATREHRPGGDL